MKSFNKEQKILAKNYIKKFLKKYNISAKIAKTVNGGYAYCHEKNKKRKIKIPKTISPYNLGVGLHEIGHIILSHCEYKKNELIDQRPTYIQEYEAEKFAINHLKKIGFYTKQYEVEAIRYVMEVIAQGLNTDYYINDVPKKIIRWTGLNLNMWKKARKITVPNEENYGINDKHKLIIQYLMPKKKKFISKFNK